MPWGLFQKNLPLLTHPLTLLQATLLCYWNVGALWHFWDYRTSTLVAKQQSWLGMAQAPQTRELTSLMTIHCVCEINILIKLIYLLCSLPVFAWPHIPTSVHVTVKTSMPAFHSQTNTLVWDCMINCSAPHYHQCLFKSDIAMGIPDLCLFLLACLFLHEKYLEGEFLDQSEHPKGILGICLWQTTTDQPGGLRNCVWPKQNQTSGPGPALRSSQSRLWGLFCFSTKTFYLVGHNMSYAC